MKNVLRELILRMHHPFDIAITDLLMCAGRSVWNGMYGRVRGGDRRRRRRGGLQSAQHADMRRAAATARHSAAAVLEHHGIS